MSNFTVAKFGGTSMGDFAAMCKAAQIIQDDPQIRVVLVSATSGTTNQLVDLYDLARSEDKQAALAIVQQIANRHQRLAQEIGCNSNDKNKIETLTKSLANFINNDELERDEVLATGEALSSLLFNRLLCNMGVATTLIDARNLIATNLQKGAAEPDIAATAQRCRHLLQPELTQTNNIVLTQGFIGSDLCGNTTTLGRGGSDLSAALIAEAIKASTLQIWTDVPGILTTDPRMVKEAQQIKALSFAEAAELANFGAKVLHPATLWPAIRNDIKILVASTFAPEDGGSWIFPSISEEPLARAIATRKDQILITVSSLRMLNAYGFLAKIFNILAKHQFSVDLVTTSEVSVALTVDGTALSAAGKSFSDFDAMIMELRAFSQVSVEDGLSLIALIGNNIHQTPGTSARAFSAIGDCNVRLVCQGASSHNFCFLVSKEKMQQAVQNLHAEFLSPENDSVTSGVDKESSYTRPAKGLL